MSEKLSKYEMPDARREMAQLEEQLRQKQREVERLEAWGADDSAVPNKGEMTFQEYMSQRPADGIIREGDQLRNAKSGQFASREGYIEQSSTADKYYNELMVGDDSLAYEAMDIQDLARLYGEKESLNDRTAASNILDIIDERINSYAVKYGWGEGQKATHYDALMDIAQSAQDSAAPAVESVATASGRLDGEVEGDVTSSVPPEEAEAPAEASASGAEGSELVISQHSDASEDGESGAAIDIDEVYDYVNDKPMRIAGSELEASDIADPTALPASDLDYIGIDIDDLSTEASDPGVGSRASVSGSATETEPNRTLSDNTPGWLRRAYNYTGTKVALGLQAFGSRGVIKAPRRKEGETQEAYEKRARNYGWAKAIGATALLGAAIWATRTHGFGLFEGGGGSGGASELGLDDPNSHLIDTDPGSSNGDTDPGGLNGESGSGELGEAEKDKPVSNDGPPGEAQDDNRHLIDRPEGANEDVIGDGTQKGDYGSGDQNSDKLTGGSEVGDGHLEFSSRAYMVDHGQGWYETFDRMGIPSSEQADLLKRVGPNLQTSGWAYLMEDGQWGISQPGQLPQDVLEYIWNNR